MPTFGNSFYPVPPADGGGGGITASQGLWTNRPASPSAGDIYYSTDRPGLTSRCFTAGAWVDFVRDIPVNEPPVGGWAWLNQGTATLASVRPFQGITCPATVSLESRVRARSVPAGNWKLTALFDCFQGNSTSRTCGLSVYDSVGGGHYRFGLNMVDFNFGIAAYYDSAVSNPGTIVTLGDRDNTRPMSGPAGLSIEDDGTDLIFRIVLPHSGAEIEHYREPRAGRMTGGPTDFGFHATANDEDSHIDLLSWSVT